MRQGYHQNEDDKPMIRSDQGFSGLMSKKSWLLIEIPFRYAKKILTYLP